VTDRPIIFSAPMVRALLDGRKTQTRRLATSPLRRCEVGDRLYVREAYSVAGIFSDVVEARYKASERRGHTEFVEQVPVERAAGAKVLWPAFRPSLHMPRWASRLTLIVEAVRVEPLKSISEADAIAEGCEAGVLNDSVGPRDLGGGFTIGPDTWASAVGKYLLLWQDLHPEWDGYSDPDVVALTFRVVRGNIDQVSA
jgi:hypothetical protein